MKRALLISLIALTAVGCVDRRYDAEPVHPNGAPIDPNTLTVDESGDIECFTIEFVKAGWNEDFFPLDHLYCRVEG